MTHHEPFMIAIISDFIHIFSNFILTSDKLRKVMFVLLLSAKANGNKKICAKSASSVAMPQNSQIWRRFIADIILLPEPSKQQSFLSLEYFLFSMTPISLLIAHAFLPVQVYA